MFPDDVFEELVTYLTLMRTSFEKYFPEEQNTKMKLNSWIHNPFLPNLQKPESMSNEIYESLLEMSSDTSMESLFKTTPLKDFWCRIRDEYPMLGKMALNILLPFPTTYLVPSSISLSKRVSSPKKIENRCFREQHFEPYYVRCIKPNDQKSPALFDDTMFEHQVAYLGLLENVRVRRAGFAYRQTYNRFLRRYKMISKYTWPNFRGGSEKDGCRVLIDEQGFSDDVRYGTTKIFIQSPQTISQLEYLRLELIPGIVVFLQKMWRGAIARYRYRKMLAALTIIKFYQHQKLRKYIDQVNHVFRNVKTMKDYGKQITWPPVPTAHKGFANILQKIHERWRAYMILRKIPREQWPEMHLKVNAAEVLTGRREDWGYHRKWEGNYLSFTSENDNTAAFVASIGNLRSKDHFQKVLFSSFIKKVNKHNKCAERAIVITDRFIYKLDSKRFKPLRSAIPITDLTGISVTPGPDQMIILHLRGGNDLVTALTSRHEVERVGELVGIIVHQWFQLQGKDLRVIVNPQLQCMLGNKSRTLAVESSDITVHPAFKKDGQNLVLLWPVCSA
ncbi:unconventional myosin ID [Trichonephila clavipes]|nr:unconventional myosin ID [Trichonephila clavipes]